MLTLKGLRCTKCGTKQYFGKDQPYGMLNRHWTTGHLYQMAVRHLWHCNRNFTGALCPTCNVVEKPRRLPKIVVTYKDPIGHNQYRQGAAGLRPLMELLWRKCTTINNIEHDSNNFTIYFFSGVRSYVLRREDLIDPMIFAQFLEKTKKPQYREWIMMALQDQLDYAQRMSAQPVERGEAIHVIRMQDDIDQEDRE